MIKRWTMGFVAAALMFAGAARAEDVSNLKAELADLKAKVASMESARAGEVAGDAEALTSMKKNGKITIGGGVTIATIITHRDDARNDHGVGTGVSKTGNSTDDEIDSTTFNTTSASLSFKIDASKNSYLMIKLDIDDFSDAALSSDDLLEEVYYMWKNVRGSNWDLAFGKKEVCFGQDMNKFAISDYSYVHSTSIMQRAWENDAEADNGHARNSLQTDHPSEIDNMFQFEATYNYKKLLKWEGAVFQNVRDMHEDRSSDTLFFQSFATRLTLTPVEGLSLNLSFVNRHDDEQRRDDSRLSSDPLTAYVKDSEADRQALSFGFDYKSKALPVELYGEYIYGWNWLYNDDSNAQVAQLGMNWSVNESINFIVEGDWCQIDDNRTANAHSEEDFYQFIMGVAYKLPSGISLHAEYMHEWYDRNQRGVGNPDYSQDMDALLLGAKWSF